MTTRNLYNFNLGDSMELVDNCRIVVPHWRRSASMYDICCTHDLLIGTSCPMRGFLHVSLLELMKRNVNVDITDGLVKSVTIKDIVSESTTGGYRSYRTDVVRHRYVPVGDLPVTDINQQVFWQCEEVVQTDRGYC